MTVWVSHINIYRDFYSSSNTGVSLSVSLVSRHRLASTRNHAVRTPRPLQIDACSGTSLTPKPVFCKYTESCSSDLSSTTARLLASTCNNSNSEPPSCRWNTMLLHLSLRPYKINDQGPPCCKHSKEAISDILSFADGTPRSCTSPPLRPLQQWQRCPPQQSRPSTWGCLAVTKCQRWLVESYDCMVMFEFWCACLLCASCRNLRPCWRVCRDGRVSDLRTRTWSLACTKDL